jgi:hypothetical protein
VDESSVLVKILKKEENWGFLGRYGITPKAKVLNIEKITRHYF